MGGSTRYFGDNIELDELDKLIADTLAAREKGLGCKEWGYQLESPLSANYGCDDWNEILGELYAIKSACIVEHAPVHVISEAMFIIAWDGLCIPFVFAGLINIPIDVIQLPIQLACRVVNHHSVEEGELSQSLENLSIARSYGFHNEHIPKGSMALELPAHLDKIGYELPGNEEKEEGR